MKTKILSPQKVMLVAIVIICTAGCKKDNINQAAVQPADQFASASSEDMSAVNRLRKLAGSYTDDGTRTLYIGDASDSVVNSVIGLKAYSPKTIVPCSTCVSHTAMLFDYADLGFLGYQYIITFKPGQKDFDLDPNDVMTANILPGSWIVYEKSFDTSTRQFHFKTGYANLYSGYDRITDETLVWQSK